MQSVTRLPRLVAVTALMVVTTGVGPRASANAVTQWNAIASTVIVSYALRPPSAALVDMAYVQAAVYDAVNAIDGRYSVYAAQPTTVAAGGSPDAAVASAAYTVLLVLYPGLSAAQKASLDAEYASALAAIPDGSAKTIGIAVGSEVATAFMASRAGDGRNANVPYTFQSGPGQYQRTPPAFANPLTPWVAKLRPFAMSDPSQFRADPPPALLSDEWADDYNETKAFGALVGSARTQEQTDIGLFYQEHPAAQLFRNVRLFASGQALTVADAARLFAQVQIGAADALIACWDSKYYYNFWRPVTAIRAGDTDGNPATDPDPSWLPLVPTPSHPEYPAAHGCVTTAFADTIADFMGTKDVTITLTSLTSPNRPAHTFFRTDDLIHEIIDARIYGGMHFRTSCHRGVVIGHKVAHWVSKHYFQPVE